MIDHPTTSPVISIIGRCDATGIEALLDLATDVNAGRYGNPFRMF